jgi:hypothetical protein
MATVSDSRPLTGLVAASAESSGKPAAEVSAVVANSSPRVRPNAVEGDGTSATRSRG